jgi:hypothetical protein
MSREVKVTITREIEIEVKVGLHKGCRQTWTDPGEPDEVWIVEATDEDDQPITLTDAESDEAVGKAHKIKAITQYFFSEAHQPF